MVLLKKTHQLNVIYADKTHLVNKMSDN